MLRGKSPRALQRSTWKASVSRHNNYDSADFVTGCRERGCTPNVSLNNVYRRSAYRISPGKRKRIEEPFGWVKTIGGLRKTRHRGRDLVE
jgi:hypothetical protein